MIVNIFSDGTYTFNLDCYVLYMYPSGNNYNSLYMGPFMSIYNTAISTYWFVSPMQLQPVTSLVL